MSTANMGLSTNEIATKQDITAVLAAIEALQKQVAALRPAPVESEYLTTDQAMRLLGCGRTTLHNKVRAAGIMKHGSGRSVLYLRTDILKLIK